MESVHKHCGILLVSLVIIAGALPFCYSQTTRRFQFNVEWKKMTRLCTTKQLLTVNGQYPGPTIAVHEGDNVEIKVKNWIAQNTTLHWHGMRQLRTGWADGPAYITQCPIRGSQSYTYKFTVTDQRGTLLWHAHYAWQRASVYCALIIYPRMPYPFSAPIQAEIPIIFGEWWNGDPDEVENIMMLTGAGPDNSNAYTINGFPGPLYPCSNRDTFIQTVEYGKTYMLRIINAALAYELFFAIAKHKLTVVEVVLQDTSFLNLENHPIHVHGHNFFIVGTGFGNFNEAKDPKRYNLVDPPERNTVAVPSGGWAAIRIKSDNPGVWFIHCHLEQHTSWGLATGFIVRNGRGPSQSMLPPPQDLPSC